MAQVVAPLYERVPPLLYGGTQRVVSYLTEELVRSGHEVTLFASGDSITNATLVAPCERALRLDKECRDSFSYHIVMLDQVFGQASDPREHPREQSRRPSRLAPRYMLPLRKSAATCSAAATRCSRGPVRKPAPP